MKASIRPIILLSCMLLSFSGCYKDLSTKADKTFPDIIIEGPDETVFAAYGQVLEISPTVTEAGRSEKDFTYLWEIDLRAGSNSNRLEIGDEKDLVYQVGQIPSELPYYLTLTVYDKHSGFGAIKFWKVYVSSSLGEGLLVAYTRDGGATSDFDLVSNDAITYGFNGDASKYTRELFTFSNGAPCEGRINSLCHTVGSDGGTYNTKRIAVGTDRHLYGLDPMTFKVIRTDNEMLNFSRSGSFETTSVMNFDRMCSGAVIDKTFFAGVFNIDCNYTEIATAFRPGNIFNEKNLAYYKEGKMTVFDSASGKFYYTWVLQVMSGGFLPVDVTTSFDAVGAECIGSGATKGGYGAHLLKDKTGKYHLCIVDSEAIPQKLREYEFSGPEIENAHTVLFTDNADIMYYATEDKIYSCLISGSQISVQALSWKPDDAAEKITGLNQYMQAYYGTQQISQSDYDFQLPYHRLQILVTTYNASTGEGKIYMRPFNVSTGKFTMKNNGVLTGFGEITAICSTLR